MQPFGEGEIKVERCWLTKAKLFHGLELCEGMIMQTE